MEFADSLFNLRKLLAELADLRLERAAVHRKAAFGGVKQLPLQGRLLTFGGGRG